MTLKEILKELRKDGWVEIKQRGSHLSLKHSIKQGKVTLAMHSGDLPPGTLNSILKQALLMEKHLNQPEKWQKKQLVCMYMLWNVMEKWRQRLPKS